MKRKTYYRNLVFLINKHSAVFQYFKNLYQKWIPKVSYYMLLKKYHITWPSRYSRVSIMWYCHNFVWPRAPIYPRDNLIMLWDNRKRKAKTQFHPVLTIQRKIKSYRNWVNCNIDMLLLNWPWIRAYKVNDSIGSFRKDERENINSAFKCKQAIIDNDSGH